MKFAKMIVPATQETINHAYNVLGYRFINKVEQEIKGFLVTDATGLMSIVENFPTSINVGAPFKEYLLSDFLKLDYKLTKEYTADDFRREITEIMDKVDYLYSQGYSVYISGAWIGSMKNKTKVITIGETEGWNLNEMSS